MHIIHVSVGICQVAVVLDPLNDHLVLFHVDHFELLTILHLNTELFLVFELCVNCSHDPFFRLTAHCLTPQISNKFVDIGLLDILPVFLLCVLLKDIQFHIASVHNRTV